MFIQYKSQKNQRLVCADGAARVTSKGMVDRQRRAVLVAAGAADVIHKDDLDSVRVAEALTRVYKIDCASIDH